MAEMHETPSANRLRIAFFGPRNAGKSTLVNAFTGQDVAIVSDVPGTTTDPVSKAMEIFPLGPCLVTDTAGLDDEGELGAMRVRRTLEVLAVADVAVWVEGADPDACSALRERFFAECRRNGTAAIVHRRGDGVDELMRKVAAAKVTERERGLLDGIVRDGERLVLVCPIDSSAPKGRLILPQVQLVRECLDRHLACVVCQPEELPGELVRAGGAALVVTDSQAFAAVAAAVRAHGGASTRLTSFSILYARQKGDLAAYAGGIAAARRLRSGDRVLVAEGCTHHRQCDDIGAVKIPKAIERLSGARPEFSFASGGTFDLGADGGGFALAVQCGGCMLTRREVLRRIRLCREAGVPVVNYGMLLAAAGGLGEVRADGTVETRE